VTTLAPLLQGFFTERLIAQRRVSPHTVSSYRDTFRLLLRFAQTRTGKAPNELGLEDLDASLITAFLDHLERERHNTVRTRNLRLVAIHSLFHFAALREPNQAALIQRVLAIPQKRFEHATVSFLIPKEIEAILACPDQNTWIGRRDHALLLVAFQTGLRVAELTSLRVTDVVLSGAGAHVSCQGKGRKQRATPLTRQSVAVLRAWLREQRAEPGAPLFATRGGHHLSTDAVERLLDKYARLARQRCPSLNGKHVTPHVIRHSLAMALLDSGVDVAVVSMWLGHESLRSTQPYVHAAMAIKQRALDRLAPTKTSRGRYRAPDALLAFLDDL
jgi:site-specific recombinase XerD